jgi:hypothetical protein
MNIEAVLSRVASDPEILNGKPCVKRHKNFSLADTWDVRRWNDRT